MATEATESTPENTSPAGRKKPVAAKTKNIYQIISAVSTESGALAPSKAGGVPFPFRGIDGTINHLTPKLREYGVITVPEVLDYEFTQREANQGKVVTSCRARVKFTFHAPDGTSVSAVTLGQADDFADRAAAQAQSVAFRVALLQTFTLPTQSPEPEQTGQAVEDSRSKGPTASDQAINKARQPQVPAKGDGNWHQKIVKEIINNTEDDRGKDDVNALLNQILKEKKLTSNDANRTKVYPELYERLKAGEVAA